MTRTQEDAWFYFITSSTFMDIFGEPSFRPFCKSASQNLLEQSYAHILKISDELPNCPPEVLVALTRSDIRNIQIDCSRFGGRRGELHGTQTMTCRPSQMFTLYFLVVMRDLPRELCLTSSVRNPRRSGRVRSLETNFHPGGLVFN